MTSHNPREPVEAIPEDIDRIATDIVRADYSKGEDEPEWLLYLAIAKAILADRQRDQWQDIGTYPNDGSDVLVCVTHNLSEDEWETVQWVDSRVLGGPWFIYPKRIDIPFPPTHWMPLPAAPKTEG